MAAPRIITARSMGLRFRSNMARMGPEKFVTGHYSGTPRARDWRSGVQSAKSFHQYHLGKGWAGIGYHYLIPDDGAIICCRPLLFNGAHVDGRNTQNVGVNMPGTTGDRPTRKQARAFNWLIHHAHTGSMPAQHRSDVDLSELPRKGHRQWPGQSTACPGLFLGMYLRGGRPWEEAREMFDPGETLEVAPGGRFESEFLELEPEDEMIPEPTPPLETQHGSTIADGIHIGAEEAEAMEDVDPSDQGELPEADPEFDEDLSEVLEGQPVG